MYPLQEMSGQLYGRRGHDNPNHSYDFEFTSSSASPNFDDGDDFVNDDDFFWKRTLDSGLVCTCSYTGESSLAFYFHPFCTSCHW